MEFNKADLTKMNIPIITSSNILTNVYERDIERKNQSAPTPYRLTYISTMTDCQFCSNPTGEVYCHEIKYLFGFISCKECENKAKEAITEWYEKHAYGRANHLQKKELKIRRSDGTIEYGWYLHDVIVNVDHLNQEYIKCVNSLQPIENVTLTRNCYIDMLLELN